MRLNIYIASFLFLMSFTVMAIEEPEFISIEKKDAFEIREYKSKLIAQVLVSGTFDSILALICQRNIQKRHFLFLITRKLK